MSIKLHFAETVARRRKANDLTQEQLAERLGVTPQAVSNWERGGYPDVTLLPALANHLGISIDELLGNDTVSHRCELDEVEKKCNELYRDPPALLEYLKPYYYKYPQEYWIADIMGDTIIREKTHLDENYPLLREACERIMKEATVPWTRENAVSYMCSACPDEEYEKWKSYCALYYCSCASEVLEDRLWYRGQKDEYYARHDVNNFYTVCHLLAREGSENADEHIAENTAKAAAWGKYRLRAMEPLLSVNGEVAPAWYGTMGQFSIAASWALFAAGECEEGYAYLERAFEWCEKWLAIPDGTVVDVGDYAAFGGIKHEKGDFWNIILPDGTKEWTPYGLLFMMGRDDLYRALTETTGGGWYKGCEGFDAVRGEERFAEYVKRAERMKQV